MSTAMASALTFFEQFLDAELALHEGTDEAALRGIATRAVEDGFRGLRPVEEPLLQRSLFKVKAWEHPRHGLVHGAVVSKATGAGRGAGKYELLLFARDVETAPVVFSVYYVCTACVALGTDFKGEVCIECRGLGWEHLLGADLGASFGEPRGTRGILAPSESLYVPEYRRDRD